MATPEQIPSDLTLEVEENLSPDRFISIVRAFFGYIDEIGKSVSAEGASPDWLVRVKEGSHQIGLDPNPTVPLEVVRAVYACVQSSADCLSSGNLDDAGLSENALKHIKTLSEFTEGARGKPVPMKLWVCKKPITLLPSIAQTIREDWRADYTDFGTVEGRLDAIRDNSGDLQLRIRDASLRQGVCCYVPEELLEDAFECFRKRVEVHGAIHYRKNGTPISINVTKIEKLPDDADLPSLDDVRGIMRMRA